MLEENILVQSDKVIGEGSFGKVYSGTYSGTPVVIKHLKDSLHQEAFWKEAEFLEIMSHSNIVSILAFDRTRIVLEQYSSDARKIDGNEELILVARDCMRGLAYMHNHNGCTRHGDVKPANILLRFDRDGVVVKAALGDMGLARACYKKEMVGTKGYMPLIRGSGDQMHDVFALGVSLLNATFDQYVHASKETYDNVSEYPNPGTNNSVDNTMQYANIMVPWIKDPLAEMLVLVKREGDTREEKYNITQRILNKWNDLMNVPAHIEPPVVSELSTGIDSEDDFRVNPANMLRDSSGSGIPENVGSLDEVRDSDFNF